MSISQATPRVLIVTPEVTYLPRDMGNIANYLSAKAGGLADVSASLISTLFEMGADVHVALPDYRTIFSDQLAPLIKNELKTIWSRVPEDRIHLAEDRSFYYMNRVYSDYEGENLKIALAFQREVINNIIPRVRPDLVHCNDWMTGLIPALARTGGIPSLFTLHNIYTVNTTLAEVEDRGIDAAYFWDRLFYERMPLSYEETREHNPVDFLVSGVFASHFVNTVSPTFLTEMADGQHGFVPGPLRRELSAKLASDCAVGILNAPDPSYNPRTDEALVRNYGPADHPEGKAENKRFLQQTLGLLPDAKAPLFFWPSRLDTVQKGCQLLADILYPVVDRYRPENLQVVFVAVGEFQKHFRDIVSHHGISRRVAVCNFDERLSRLAYAASDFVLMPSRFEPCGLPQMIGPVYGTIPVARDTGGIHDTVLPLDARAGTGNGILFETYDSGGLSWAMDRAMDFFRLPRPAKNRQIERIMTRAAADFTHTVTARHYIDLYETMLRRPLV